MLRRALLLALLASLAAPAAASARVDRRAGPVQQPALVSPTFAVSGRGWGHGVGMSQYGALGFALRGVGYARILAHYYRGTVLGPAPVRRVRVLIADGRGTLTIRSAAPFRVADADGKTHVLPAGSHSFGPGLSLKPQDAERAQRLPGPLLFSPGTQPLTLGRPYRGQIHVSVVSGKLRAINVVGLEQYLYGVVPSEVPSSWPAEALKAQAVAARSYALSHLQGGAFDLYDDVRSQVYLGIPHEKATTNAAVDATAGEVVLYAGRVAKTFFFSTSGGRTMSAQDAWGTAVPYLVSVPDPHDSLSPYHDWGPFPFTAARLARVLRVPGKLVGVTTTRNRSGRAEAVVATGTQGQVTVPAADVRRTLKLRSTWFDVGTLAFERPASTPVVYGTQTTLSGLARGMPAVVLEERRAGATSWSAVGTVRAGADGRFAVAVKPLVTTRYRLASGKMAGAAIRVGVAPLVRLYP
ncbi:MAG: SpoIID/LytB domain-containing protein, partial [Actinomycetota bacterium]|nr:SpoIID/LytB domain-containing protein [Actinomycetota bacterium]